MLSQKMSTVAIIMWAGREFKVWIEEVTPERAEQVLATNEGNRVERASRIARYAADMRSGRWPITGESIRLDEQGRLLNGQHRLRAVVLSGCSVPMMFVSGISADTRFKQDTGLPKADGDWSPISVQAIRIVKAVARLAVPFATQMSPDEIIHVYNAIGADHVEWAIATAKSDGITRKAPVRAALALLHKINPARAEVFMRRLCENDLPGKTPESTLDASFKATEKRGLKRYDKEIENSMRTIVAAAQDKPIGKLQGLPDAEKAWLLKATCLERLRGMRQAL